MNQKKCPKCGELNPPEAVMCWACYTPLSGDGGSAAAAPRPAVQSEEREKPGFATWQIGLVVVVLLGAIGFGAKTFLGSSSEEDGDMPAPTAPDRPGPRNNIGGNNNTNTNFNSSIPSPSPGTQPVQPATPQTGSYSVVASPNPKYTWGVIGIVPSDPNTTTDQAAQMAAGMRQKMMSNNKKWAKLHIYVFKDRQTGNTFRKYQTGRKGAPLDGPDYQNLSGNVWPNTLIRYEYDRGVEGVQIPQQNPTAWWGTKTNFAKVSKPN